jgi:hypothetical protein
MEIRHLRCFISVSTEDFGKILIKYIGIELQ